jgi:hypothetical protein
VKIDANAIAALVQGGFMVIENIQKLKAAHAARAVEFTDGPDGPVLADDVVAGHFAKWEAGADEASAHASQRIEDRHRDDA